MIIFLQKKKIGKSSEKVEKMLLPMFLSCNQDQQISNVWQ